MSHVDRFRKNYKRKKKLKKMKPDYSGLPPFESTQVSEPAFLSKEKILFKMLLSALLFFSVAILFKQSGDHFSHAKAFVQYTFEQDFQFASVADWYEKQFGKPLAILPERLKKLDSDDELHPEQDYALPVAGKIVEPFDVEKKGIVLETGVDATIECIQDGFVVFVGEKEDLNKTVIVQHPDGSESWYGNLASVEVGLYDYIKSGHPIGKASKGSDGKSGMFFFAIKRGESFIDPIQVMSFD